MPRTRRLALALLAAAGLAACGGATQQTPGIATLVSRASSLKINSLSFSLDTTVPSTGTSAPTTVSATGTLQVHPSLLGQFDFTVAGRTISERIIGSTIYVKIPALAARDGGKPWIAVDLTAASSASGIDLGALLKEATSADPSKTLRLLTARGVFHETGTSTINGQRVSVVVGSFTPATLTSPALTSSTLSPKILAQVKAKLDQIGATREDITMYLLPSGLPVRIVTSLVTTSHGTIASTIDMHAVNVPVTVTPPPASQTITLAEARKLGG